MTNQFVKNISSIRTLLKKRELDGIIVPSYDEFNNEYTPDYNNRLKFLTGFKGSNGLLLLTLDKALFFTDSRYLTQAEQELCDIFEIYNLAKMEGVLTNNFPKSQKDSEEIPQVKKIVYDPWIESMKSVDKWACLLKATNLKLVSAEANLVDKIWENRPKHIISKPFLHQNEFADRTIIEKKDSVLVSLEADFLLISASDSACWLLNLRGSDVPCTPIVLIKCLVSKSGEIEVFANTQVVDDLKGLLKSNAEVHQINHFKTRLKEIASKKNIIQLDCEVAPSYIREIFEEKQLIIKQDICRVIKAQKTIKEQDWIRHAHLEHGVALAKFVCWLEDNLGKVSEFEAAIALNKFMKLSPHFVEQSFDTISAYGANAAIVHYRPEKSNSSIISQNNIYLLDSGGQYYSGTTDITRTFHFGKANQIIKKNYTLALKGLINLSKMRFPKKLSGCHLDAVARYHLWQHCLDYGHSTGHGVGYFLSVHESPPNISLNSYNGHLLPGMVLSIEPGYYQKGAYGIRIENLVLIKESEINREFLEFDTLSIFPINTNLIDFSLLEQGELIWLKKYNESCITKLSSCINSKELNVLKKHLILN